MVPLERLRPGDRVAVAPFEGVPYEAPTDEVIVSKEAFVARWAQFGKTPAGLIQVLPFLEQAGLLPLRSSRRQATPYLCKILGFVFGRRPAALRAAAPAKASWRFSGDAADLEDIRADIRRVGFTPSQVYAREPPTRPSGPRTRTTNSSGVRSTSRWSAPASPCCWRAWAAPVGNKTRQSYEAPLSWLDGAPAWQPPALPGGLVRARR